MNDSWFYFFILGLLLVCFVLWRSGKGKEEVVPGSTKGTFFGGFEMFGIAMVRGTNLLIFLGIILAGFVVAAGMMSERNPAMAVVSVCGAFLVAGLVTGLLSMFAQTYESAVVSKDAQLKILKELEALNRKS